jgi:PAS domain S-box-containing protein
LKTLLYQLLDCHDRALLLVRANGLLEKANTAAQATWPALVQATDSYLWQVAAVSRQKVEQFLKQAAENDQQASASLFLHTSDAHYQLGIVAIDKGYCVLKLTTLKQSEIELPQATAPSLSFLNALLNGISNQLLAVLDIDMRYITFNEAYKKEYARIFAIDISPGDHLLDTLRHVPGEQEKIHPIWEQVLKGEEFTLLQTFGHSSLAPTTYSLHFFPLKDDKENLLGVLYRVADVTKERIAEGLLRDSEERFRILAENTPDMVVRYGPGLQVLFANTAVELETGAAPDELLNKTLYDASIAANISESYVVKINQVFESGLGKDLISTYNAEGDFQDYYTRFIPEKTAEGKTISVLAVSKNISSLKEAQEELLQARDFSFMTDILPLLIWVTEADGDAVFYNKGWYEYTGLSKEDTLRWGWQLVIHPEDLQSTLMEWQDSLQRQEPYQSEYRMRRHDGSYRWFMSRAMPLKNAEGEVVKWYGFSADIHEQKQNRTQLAERAQELQLLNQMIPQIVWATKPNGDHEYFNQRWFEYTGLSYSQSKDQGWSTILHPDDYDRTLTAWTHCLRTGDPYQIEYRFKRHDGVYRWFIGRATPQRNAEGHIVKWFGTCTDIHDQKQQSETLARKNYELNQINAYLDQFVHTAAHDLRSPVANMKLLYEMLQKEESPQKRSKLFDTFKPLLNRLDNTIIGLVEIVQMQEGHSSLRVQEVDPVQVVREVKEELATNLETVQATLTENIILDKPLYYLKPYLLSIVRNLLSNAIKYRHHDRALHIHLQGAWQGRYYLLQVQDNGIGIDLQRNNKNLFKPFKRLTQQAEGLGIGLHMVQNMVSKNGGHIEVISEPGKGTTFSIFLYPYEF